MLNITINILFIILAISIVFCSYICIANLICGFKNGFKDEDPVSNLIFAAEFHRECMEFHRVCDEFQKFVEKHIKKINYLLKFTSAL